MFSDKNNKNTLILSSVLTGTAVLELIVLMVLERIALPEMMKCFLVVLMFIFCMMYFIVSNAEKYYKDNAFIFILSGIFLIYMTVVSFSNDFLLETAFYLTGGILLALLTDYHLGMILNFALLVYSALLYRELSYELIFNFAISLLICILVKSFKGYSSLLLICLITSVVQIIVSVVRADFNIGQLPVLEVLGILAVTILFIAASFVVNKLVHDFKEEMQQILDEAVEAEIATSIEVSTEASTETETTSDILDTPVVVEAVAVTENVTDNKERIPETEKPIEKIDYKKYISEEFPLYVLMKEKYSKTFVHSKYVADLSRNIASAMEVNADLCYAGALYHEAAKFSKNGGSEGENQVIRQYELPDKIAELIRQHNYKNTLPTSLEAVIVMISDNIITMYEFMLKSGKEVTMPKLVDNTFQLHFNKGTIEEAGISIKDFNRLRQLFQTEMVFFKFSDNDGGKNDN